MSQIAFTIFGVSVHWYGIMIAFAIVGAIVLGCFICKYRNVTRDDLFELLIWVLPPAIIGARLYFLIFNNGPWGIQSFEIWTGGLAVYGSIIGGAVGAILYCVIRKKNFFDVADVVVPCLLLGQAIGRIGCYFGGCCYGIETTNESLKFFPVSVQIDGVWHLSTFFYESFLCLISCVVLVVLLRKIKEKGIIFSGYLILYGIIRAVLESLRDDSAALFIGSVKVSLLLSILLIVCGIAFVVWKIIRYSQKRNRGI